MNPNLSYSPETPNLDQNWQCFKSCDLEIWRMTFKNNRTPFLSNIKLCASFHHHMWIQTGITVRKQLNWVLTSVTFTFYMDITSVNGNNSWKLNDDTMRGTLWKMCQRWKDERTDRSILRAAWSQLKIATIVLYHGSILGNVYSKYCGYLLHLIIYVWRNNVLV